MIKEDIGATEEPCDGSTLKTEQSLSLEMGSSSPFCETRKSLAIALKVQEQMLRKMNLMMREPVLSEEGLDSNGDGRRSPSTDRTKPLIRSER